MTTWQQGVQTDTTHNIQQCCVRLHSAQGGLSWYYVIGRFSVQYCGIFLQVTYFDEPVGRVKIQETSKNISRYYTLNCRMRDLLFNLRSIKIGLPYENA